MTAALLTTLLTAFLGGFLLPLAREWIFGSATEQAVKQKLSAAAAAQRAEEEQMVRAAADEAARAQAQDPTDGGLDNDFRRADP